MAPLITNRDELAATVGPEGHIYAIGGHGGPSSKCLDSVERFNIDTGQWESLGNLT